MEDGRPLLLAGIRRFHSFAAAAASVPAQWEEFARTVLAGGVPGQVGATTYGAMCQTDVPAERFEYLAGVEVAALERVPAGLGRMRVPAQRYAVFEHRGRIADIRATWGAIWQDWLPRSGFAPAPTPDFERYDERFEPASGEGVVEIWFPIAPLDARDRSSTAHAR